MQPAYSKADLRGRQLLAGKCGWPTVPPPPTRHDPSQTFGSANSSPRSGHSTESGSAISMHSANSAQLSAARLHARSGADATRAQLLLGAHPKQCMTARLRSKTWRGALNLVECIAYSAPLTKRLIRLSRASLSYVQLAPTQQPRRLQCLDGGSSHFRVMKDERIDSIVTSLQGKHRNVLDYTI